MTMNNKPLKTAISAALAIALVGAGASAFADNNGRHRGNSAGVYDYARVLSAEPNYRYVTVTTPVKECWDDVEYYTTDRRPAGVAGSTLFGAIVGGVIGHQFGSGRGNDAATAVGSIVGAAVGNSSATRANANYRPTEYSRPVRRCETNYRSREEQRIDGYRVIYSYNGRKYATDMPYDPGKQLRIRVDVQPAA
jgi:uncharacterized protein YcfJ